MRNNTLKNVYFGIVVTSGDNVLIEHNTIEHVAGDGIVIMVDNLILRYNTITNFYKIDGNHGDAVQFHRGQDTTTPILLEVI